MKKILSLQIIALIMLLAVSCVEDGPEAATLTLSHSVLTFEKEGGDAQTVTVTTNQGKWMAEASGDWLTVEQDVNTLKIKAQANLTPQERKTWIGVWAGGAMEKINIVQNAADFVVKIVPGEIIFPQWKQTQTFEVISNGGIWSAEVEAVAADWISCDPKVHKNEITVSVKENTGAENRVGKIIITAGNKKQELSVLQRKEPIFVLPYLPFGADPVEVEVFEEERGGKLLRKIGSGKEKKVFIDYEWKTPVFVVGRYAFLGLSSKATALFFSEEYIPRVESLRPEFDLFMKENEFEQDSKNKDIYMSRKKQTRAILYPKTDKTGEPRVFFELYGVQKQPCETFKVFPYGMNNFNATATQIKEWEAQNGGVLIPSPYPNPNMLLFDVKTAPYKKRSYMLTKDTPQRLQGVDMVFNETTLGFFQYLSKSFLTNEAKELLAKEGFQFREETPFNPDPIYDNSSVYIYESKEKNRLVYFYIENDETFHIQLQEISPAPAQTQLLRLENGTNADAAKNNLTMFLKQNKTP